MPDFAPDQSAASHGSGFADCFAYSSILFAGFQRIAELNLQTAQAAFDESQQRMQALLASRDLRKVLDMQNGLTPVAADKACAYTRQLYEITSEMQAGLAQLAQARFQQAVELAQSRLSHATAPAVATRVAA
ncbi:phasin family protein [compost metagenome]